MVTGFVDALGFKDATLVGQDWGGPIGLAAAQRRPGVFDRLVLANTWAWPVDGDLYVEGAGLYVETDAPEEFVAAIRGWAT
ncbi:hypothetical protein GCM10027598_46600 [Amycolatopsis oliviviridis]|uniref:AB hydrolase-1 domain-containing protein n=1 Tax=Amycolatopsis oliviviridis TaxID=1471590 RepID=A0ABQ3L877_9PSEU|nr:alpha/beta fold hydrolase [Amycolatopsis oliviviridis]GHH08433.1 hypothetical protein GCM10017790_15240 [Amycolatopsis oliviviridis]